jgi:hypothetical protein
MGENDFAVSAELTRGNTPIRNGSSAARVNDTTAIKGKK